MFYLLTHLNDQHRSGRVSMSAVSVALLERRHYNGEGSTTVGIRSRQDISRRLTAERRRCIDAVPETIIAITQITYSRYLFAFFICRPLITLLRELLTYC